MRPRSLTVAEAGHMKALLLAGYGALRAARMVGCPLHVAVSIKRGETYREVAPGPPVDAAPEWHKRRLERLYALGYWLYEHEAEAVATWNAGAIAVGAHVLLYGPSPFGLPHVIVGRSQPRNGLTRFVPAWDPNPGRHGLAKVEHVDLLVRR